MVALSIPPTLRTIRMWRWLIVLCSVGLLLYTLEVFVGVCGG